MSEDAALPTPIIRAALETDLPAILKIFAGDPLGGHKEAASPGPMEIYTAAFAIIRDSAANHLFVAEIDGAVVGTYQLTLIPGLVNHGRMRAKIESVHVLPAFRGKGIGAAMMRHAIAEAKTRGAGMAELTSNKARKDAHRFYERLGFTRSHEGFKLVL